MSVDADKLRTGFNKVLADRYFSVASQYTGSWDTYLKQKKIIAGAEVDITAFYDEHKSLNNLGIKGVGPKTRHVLEIILEEGREAREIISREKESGLHQTPKDKHLYDIKEVMPKVTPKE